MLQLRRARRVPSSALDAGAVKVIPISLREANDFVEQFHRHNKRAA
jgi:hypothetical protein